MSTSEVLRRLETRAHTAENIIKSLRLEVEELKKQSTQQGYQNRLVQLQAENEVLRKQVEEWKQKLVHLECQNGVKQIPLPGDAPTVQKKASPQESSAGLTSNKKEPSTVNVAQKVTAIKLEPAISTEKQLTKVKGKGEKKAGGDSASGKKKQEPAEELPVDVGRLDFRIGKIISAKKHPDADSLYVEEVDVGEGKMRTVVSGLVAYVPVEEMQNRLAVLLCNLKPVKMRGVTSEAMVMCASTPAKVEVLIPPAGAVPGDVITFEGYERRPDPILNPKKKIFETVAPDLKTNSNKIATYKGIPFSVAGKGVVTAPSLIDVQIK